MPKKRSKQTDKNFEEYNAYHDRGMIKWLTAFAMEELVTSIAGGKEEAMKAVPSLPQMDAFAIDEVLVEALKGNRPISIQLNQKDHFGRQTESIEGHFRGYLADNNILIDDEWISLESIRNVQILNEGKWFKIGVSGQAQKSEDRKGQKSPLPSCFDSEERGPLGGDGSWFEDLYQDDEWME